MDYLKTFNNAESKLQTEDYVGCIRDCGLIAELGLKELYERQKAWARRNRQSFTLLRDFRKNHQAFRDFKPETASLFQLLKFFRIMKIWEQIQVRVESNLHFTKRIPWHDLRYVRNKATHSYYTFTREQAVEFLHHIKIFLHECELAETKPSVIFENRRNCLCCDLSLKQNWNFCPSCGAEQKCRCTNCKRELEIKWKVCPFCSQVKESDKMQEEAVRLFRAYCEAVWADDVVNAEEREMLRRKRLELGISEELAEEIEAEVVPHNVQIFSDLIQAVLIDGVIDDHEMEFLFTKAKNLEIPIPRAQRLVNAMYSGRKVPMV